jgi:uncharacterized protein YjbI with pentapeptide repeats
MADLQGADFSGAELKGVTMIRAKNLEKAVGIKTNISKGGKPR